MYCNTKAGGARIRELRIAKNFTQDDLAEHMNVSRGFIMAAGHLGEKNGNYYAVLSYTDAFGKRRTKWVQHKAVLGRRHAFGARISDKKVVKYSESVQSERF